MDTTRAHVWLVFVFVICNVITLTHGYKTWSEYIEVWNEEYPMEARKLYPFGEEFHDISASKAQRLLGFDPGIDFNLPFYGVSYPSVYISIHGHIAPSLSTPAEQVNWQRAAEDVWPNQYYPNVPDPPFIAPFYAESSFNQHLPDNMESSRLYYRLLHSDSSSSATDVPARMLDHITADVRAAVVGAHQFSARDGMVVTWYKYSHSTANCATRLCPRNTVQAAVVTDGINTYAVFNYYEVKWIGTGSQGCDPQTGLPVGLEGTCKPAHLGFNGGEARGFTALPYSGTELLRDLDTMSGTDVPGRFIYQISQHHNVRGGCTNDTMLSNDIWPLEAHPSWGGMLGGHEVTISAPCFFNTALMKCRFGAVATDVVRNHDTMMLAVCKQPILEHVGSTRLELSVDGGLSYKYHAPYNVVLMDHIKEKVYVEPATNNWLDSKTLTVTWDTSHLPTTSYQTVDIKLYGYKENHDGTNVWRELHTIVTGITNSGFYTILPQEHQCEMVGYDAPCLDYEVGMIQINVNPADPLSPRRIWSDALPLIWYTQGAMEDELGGAWPHEACRRWHGNDITDDLWHQSISPCPCVLHQARYDVGRFLPDPLCNQDVSQGDAVPGRCPGLTQGLKCFRSVGFSGAERGGSLCCYRSEDEAGGSAGEGAAGETAGAAGGAAGAAAGGAAGGAAGKGAAGEAAGGAAGGGAGQLVYSGDTHYGSIPSRRHPWWYRPVDRNAPLRTHSPAQPHYTQLGHTTAPHVPVFTHWVYDVIPYYHCCQWQQDEFDCYGKFITNRLTIGCESYLTPGQGTVYGDPHIRTLDGTLYTFNGRGEFWLVRVPPLADTTSSAPRGYMDEFAAQVRFEQPERGTYGMDSDVQATVLTSIVMQHQNGTIVEIKLSKYQQHTNKLSVLVNKRYLQVSNITGAWHQYDDVVILADSHDPVLTSITVSFTCGFGVKVFYELGLMQAQVSLPPEYRTHTLGLLGSWNGNPRDDLIPADGGQSVPPDDTSRVHYQFGITWNIAELDSRFMYTAMLRHKYFERLHFLPSFETAVNSPICEGNSACNYDLGVTGNEDIATATLAFEHWSYEVREHIQAVAACGWLNVTQSVKAEPFSYLQGHNITITRCRDGFQLQGATHYTCTADSSMARPHWPPITTKCVATHSTQKLDTRIAIALGIAAGIILLVVIIGVVALVCYVLKKRRYRRDKQVKIQMQDHSELDNCMTKSGSFKGNILKPKQKKPPRPVPDPEYDTLCAADLHVSGEDEENNSDDQIQNVTDNNKPRDLSHGSAAAAAVPDTALYDNRTGRKKKTPPYTYPKQSHSLEPRVAPYKYPSNVNSALTDEELVRTRINARNAGYIY